MSLDSGRFFSEAPHVGLIFIVTFSPGPVLSDCGSCDQSLCWRLAELLVAQRLLHQQRVFVGLVERQAVERVSVGAQRVDGGTAIVHDAVQQAEFRGGTAYVSHADVHADVRQAALWSAVPKLGLQFLGGGLSVTAGEKTTTREIAFTAKC